MNVISRAAVTAAVLVGLAACGGPKELTAVPQPAPSVIAPSPTAETLYVEMLRQHYHSLTDEEAREAVGAGRMVCAELGSGTTLHELNFQLVKQQVDPHWAASVVGFGIMAFCPERASLLSE